MQVPLQITIRDIEHSEFIEQKIRKKAEKLNSLSDQIIACHVVVEVTQDHKHKGKLYNLRINLTVPGKELVVNHNAQENLYVSIRDAFNDMMRQLEERVRKLHGEVKTHPDLMQGKIVRIFEDDDFGFISTVNGEEYYFNADNVLHNRFKKLAVGTEVSFVESMGDEGPQAHRVRARERRNLGDGIKDVA